MTGLKALKATIREFVQIHYDDERLAMLLAHAQDGKLAYHSCCCLIGVVTANHALRGFEQVHRERFWDHYYIAKKLPGARSAEAAYAGLSDEDDQRRRMLIPIIKAEFKRRRRTVDTTHKEMALVSQC